MNKSKISITESRPSLFTQSSLVSLTVVETSAVVNSTVVSSAGVTGSVEGVTGAWVGEPHPSGGGDGGSGRTHWYPVECSKQTVPEGHGEVWHEFAAQT